MPQADQEESAAEIILAPFRAAKILLRDEQQMPQHVWLYYLIKYMRLMRLWPIKKRQYFYNTCYVVIIFIWITFLLSVTFDLYASRQDALLFGEDCVMVIGLALITGKALLYRSRMHDIEAIVAEFDALRARYVQYKSQHPQICRWQRFFFLGEFFVSLAFMTLGLLLVGAIAAQPLISAQSLPLRAKDPLGLHDEPQLAPFFYGFQCFCLWHMIVAIVIMDNIGINSFNLTTLNLKMLCIDIQELGQAVRSERELDMDAYMWHKLREIVQFHQQIIALVDKVNDCYYWSYLAQMAASTFMICLTAFEAMLASDDPMVAIKFQMYMLSAFMQLFYWCLTGNMVYFNSLEVANVAFGIHKWYERSPRFQRNLMFLIQRAQKPLEYRPRPMFAFSFQTFTSILSSSYSYFALLRTMYD